MELLREQLILNGVVVEQDQRLPVELLHADLFLSGKRMAFRHAEHQLLIREDLIGELVDVIHLHVDEAHIQLLVPDRMTLIVSIDSEGRNYFEEKKIEYNKRKDEQIEIISKQVGFIK